MGVRDHKRKVKKIVRDFFFEIVIEFVELKVVHRDIT